MTHPEDDGWEASAGAWIAEVGDLGDYGRRYVLDRPMLARVRARAARNALDVGCGEGRFCRLMQAQGIETVGVEPTGSLRRAAVERDPEGAYLDGRAEALALPNASFDLVVSYLTLIDIDDVDAAIAEMARVLRPAGALLIANLNSFATAGRWREQKDGARAFALDHYLAERAEWASWSGVRVRNWRRPFATYMQPLLGAGLRLTYFDEPAPSGGDAEKGERYRRAPWFHIMEWERR